LWVIYALLARIRIPNTDPDQLTWLNPDPKHCSQHCIKLWDTVSIAHTLNRFPSMYGPFKDDKKCCLQAIQFIRGKNNSPSMSSIAHSSHMDIFQVTFLRFQ
jgi:hypothetical protein